MIPYGKRRPVGKPLSWGEAMIASVYAFGVMFLAFGVVPHQWIDHADKNLGWSKDKIIYGPGGILKPQSAGGWNPITLQYEAVRDIVVVADPRDLLRPASSSSGAGGRSAARSPQPARDRDQLATAARW